VKQIFVIGVIVLCFGLSEASSPPCHPSTPWWLSTGVGVASNERDGLGAFGRSSLNVSFAKYRFVAFRYLQTLEPMLQKWDRMREFSLMAGLCTLDSRWGMLPLTVGWIR